MAASQDIASWILPDYRALGKSGIISERQFNGNVINLSCSPAQGKPPEAASRHGRRAMTRPLPL
ncbi:MAG: hypothetical protein DI559_15995, partial [Ectopseudomonas oleovorans]